MLWGRLGSSLQVALLGSPDAPDIDFLAAVFVSLALLYFLVDCLLYRSIRVSVFER